MRYLKFLAILLVALALVACPWYGYRYPDGKLPAHPVNLEDFNSEYDDYNATAPALGRLIPFCYSTNSHSQGEDFDIKYEPMEVMWDKATGDLTVSNELSGFGGFRDYYGVLLFGVKGINSTGNELGPNLLYDPYSEFEDAELVLLYATDVDGDYDIAFTYNTEAYDFAESEPVAFLNSQFNDLYPSFDFTYSRIYFCSDREDGIYNIFHVDVAYLSGEIIPLLSDSLEHTVEADPVLSSEYEDKCPYIYGNTMVFASTRPGGSGGFDLYYSLFEEGAWSDPVNFGGEINTAFDEYRPILFDEEIDNDRNLMIFSSDRTGGKGGFDLYFVGILTFD